MCKAAAGRFAMPVCVISVLLAGCGGDARRSLSPADFASGNSGPVASAPTRVYSVEPPPPPPTVRLGATDASVALPGLPADTEPAATTDESRPASASGEPMVLDAKVGDVNGRPIIASVFLEDLMPRLRASLRSSPSRAAWRREATQIVREKLFFTIRDEVLYREAKAQLPPEVRQGLLFYLGRFREQIRLQNAGSVSRADELLREQTGQSLEEFLRSQQRQSLISGMLDGAASDYTPVTWSDVRNEYARRFDEFNPPPTVFARMILPPGDAEAELVHGRLSSGEPFDVVARDREMNRYRPSSGGMVSDEGTRVDGDLLAATLVGFPSLNAALVVLEPGSWAGPIEYRGGRQGFVSLERVETGEQRDLEDGMLQLELRAEIEFRRKSEARERLFRQLIDDAGFGDRRQRELTAELVRIAEARLIASGG
ncbi:MAG: hypothetical protein AAGJ54_07910 [Planctomycetota bacterium]